MTELTMCECGHPAIHHFSHGRCGMDQMEPPVSCACFNLVPRVSESEAQNSKDQLALALMRSLSINPAIPEGFRTMMKESLDR